MFYDPMVSINSTLLFLYSSFLNFNISPHVNELIGNFAPGGLGGDEVMGGWDDEVTA